MNYRILWPDDDENNLDEESIQVIKGLLSFEPSLRFQLEGNRTIFSEISI